MKLATLAFAAVAVIVTVPAYSEPLMGMGSGTASCKIFLSDIPRNNDFFFQWAQGFMSALNVSFAHYEGTYRDLTAVDASMQKEGIGSYCINHPDKTYFDAVMWLYNGLPLKSIKKAK